MYKVVVLMSTYNGEKYLRQQLESILKQEGVEIDLHIRDDGSTDKTIEILKEYASRYNNITYYQGENLRPCKSFMELISAEIEGDFYALADQDDVWDTDKLKVAVNKLIRADNSKPTMYYSNLRIVDSNLCFCRNSHSRPLVAITKYEPLVENLATGCTIVYNTSLHDILTRYTVKNFSMHDTWIYMVASIFGETIYDFTPHISYRQHDNNVVGTYKNGKSISFYWKKIMRLFDRKLQPRYENAKYFYKVFMDVMPDDYKEKFEKILVYKKNLQNRWKLFWDRDIRANRNEANIRLRLMILMGLL